MHQICVAETLVLNGAAVWNAEFDPAKPLDEMIYITHPDLVASFDESESSLDGTEDTPQSLLIAPKSQYNPVGMDGRTVLDDGEVLATKGKIGGSVVGGSVASGKALPMLAIVTGQSIYPEWLTADGTVTPPQSGIIGKDGQFLQAQMVATAKGGANNDVGRYYLRHVIMPSLNAAPGCGEDFIVSPEPAWRFKDSWAHRSEWYPEELKNGTHRKRRGTVCCDGHGSHLTVGALKELREPSDQAHEPVDMCLRTPHCSSNQQNEDIENFRRYKPAWRKSKAMKTASNMMGYGVLKLDAQNETIIHCPDFDPDKPATIASKKLGLDMLDFMPCVKEPYEHAFCLEANRKGWEKAGLYPFTSKVYWDLRSKEEALASAMVTERQRAAMPLIDMSVMSAAAAYRNTPTPTVAPEGAPSTTIAVQQTGPPPKKVRKVALGSGNLGLRDKPVTSDNAHQMVVDDTNARQAAQVEKIAKQDEAAAKKRDATAAMCAHGVQLQPKLDLVVKACTTRRKVEPNALLARLNSKEFSVPELKALLAARMHTPTTKGGKVALARQLQMVLVGGPAPLLLAN